MVNIFDTFIKKVKELPQQVAAIPQLFNQSQPSTLVASQSKPQRVSSIMPKETNTSAQLTPKAEIKSNAIFDSFIKKGNQALETLKQSEPGRIVKGFFADQPGTYKEGPEQVGEALAFGLPGGAAVAGGIKSISRAPKVLKDVKDITNVASKSEKIVDPVNKIIAAIREAKPIREGQELLYSKARGEKLAKVMGIRGQKEGEKGFFKELGALKGELPKVQYESIRNKVNQQDIDDLFNIVKDTTKITDWEKINAQVGLSKIFNKVGGAVPTEGELRLLKDVFGNSFTKTLLNKRPTTEKVKRIIEDIVNIPRTLVSSIDLSAPFRQGIFLMGRPKQFIPAFKSMFEAFASDKAYQSIQDAVKTKPSYQAMRDHGLAITDVGTMTNNEDAFLSNIAGKLPGIKHSARAYTGFLTKLRADVFDDIVNKTGVKDPKALRDLANYVNAATGRGKLPEAFEKAAPIFNAVFFSPRLIASRLQLLNPITYIKMDPVVRKEAIKDLLKTTGIITSILGLAKLHPDVSVGTEPTSADWGKPKIGNTRYDITGGFQPYLRLMAQLISGKITSSTTGKTITLGEGYRALTRDEILLRFFSGKEAPVASFVHDLLRGTNAIGEPLDFKTFDPSKNAILQRFTPLFAQDMYEAFRDEGLVGVAKAAPGLFGIGAQTYGGTPTTLGEAEQKGNRELYKYLKSRPKEEANKYLEGLEERDPQKLIKLSKFKEIEDAGLGEKEFNMVGSGIKDGTRIKMIMEVINTLPDKESKNAYLDKLDEVGLTNDTVYEQLSKFKEEGKLR